MLQSSVGGSSAGRRHLATTTRPILVAIFAVVASFLASTVLTESRAAGIDAAAVSIAENAGPSIEHLAAARADLRRLQALLADYVNRAVLGRPGDLRNLTAARANVTRDIEAYLVLPVYPGERDLWQTVSTELDGLDRLSGQVLALVSEGHAAQANEIADRELRAAFDRTSDAIMASIDFNGRQTRSLASVIEEHRGRARRVTLMLDALSISLAVIAGGVAIAFIRRHERLLSDHTQLIERRADELDRFAARVAHDISGPLGTVVLANRVVARKLADDPEAQRTISRGERAAHRVRRIVDGLLDFARAGAQPEPGLRAEVKPVIEDIAIELAPIAQAVDAELRVEPFAPCEVAASPGALTSLASNLMRNAIKYLGEAAVRRVVVRVLEADGMVRVEVEDTGPGVPPALEGSVFQPYVRGSGTGEPGLGLGLATVKSLAEAHGGHVGLRTAVGRGSVFWFELPKPSCALAPQRPESLRPGMS
jgi:signal transduction histidine kinase